MASIEIQLLDQWDKDVQRGAEVVFDRYVDLVRKDPAVPVNEGDLRDGIERDATAGRSTSPAIFTTVRSTARTADGADYGAILDQSTGRVVEASSYGHRAFGPIRPPLSGGIEFLPRFRVSTKHVGWWDKANSLDNFNQAAAELDAFNL